MTLAIITNETLGDIGDAIRERNGSTDTYTPAEMPDAIRAIASGGAAFPPEAVTGISAKTGNGKVGLLWDDPGDTVYLDYDIAEWEATRIVRKAGSAPESASDGTVVGDFTARDGHVSSHYVDTGLSNGTTYYYGFFPRSAAGAYRVQASEIVSALPSALGVAAPTGMSASGGNASATIAWSDPADIADTASRYGTAWAKTVLVRKAGSAPSSPSDGTVVVTNTTRGKYASSGYTDSGLANDTTYHYAAFAYSADGAVSAAARASCTPKSLEIVSWADGTWDQIAAMLEAHYDGSIDIHDHWKVGDVRTVSLSAMAATGVGESHVAQNVEIVLKSADHYTIHGTSKKAAFVFGQKDALANGTTAEYGYMNSSRTNAGGWDGCARRTWCNSVYKAALPSGFQSILKQVDIVTASAGNSSTTTPSTDYIFLDAEMEIFGSTTYANATAESGLKQYEYYETAANRIRKAGPNGSAIACWERSPYGSNTYAFCYVTNDGAASASYASSSNGVAPSGCI